MIVWVVLGTAVIVTVFILGGMLLDRKVPLLPRSQPPVPPPPKRLSDLAPGESAATAVRVPVAWRTKIAAGRCSCGQALAVQSDEPLRIADRRVVVVRLACGACGHARSVYLEPSLA